MNDHNSNIELGSRPSSNSRPHIALNPNYIPQVDDADDNPHQERRPEFQLVLPMPQLDRMAMRPAESSSFCSRIWNDKAINIPMIFFFCLYIIDLVPICCGVATLFRLASTFNYGLNYEIQTSLLKPLGFMSANLKADPIMDIQLVEKGSNCSLGFEPLKLATWPGTIQGCLCESGELYGSSCKEINSPKCMTDIPKTSSIDMYEWADHILCTRRAVLGADYIRKAECPSEYKECYTGGCFLKECPITQVEINSQGEFVFNKSQGELPIINVQITLGDIPCFTQKPFSQTIKSSSYDLAAIKENSCDKYGRYSKFFPCYHHGTALF